MLLFLLLVFLNRDASQSAANDSTNNNNPQQRQLQVRRTKKSLAANCGNRPKKPLRNSKLSSAHWSSPVLATAKKRDGGGEGSFTAAPRQSRPSNFIRDSRGLRVVLVKAVAKANATGLSQRVTAYNQRN